MKHRWLLVPVLAVLVFGLVMPASARPRPLDPSAVTDNKVKNQPAIAALAGEWLGLAETRNERFEPESLKVKLFIKADGSVTGTLGAWNLQDAAIRRTEPKERQTFQSEFVITGLAVGMKNPEGSKNTVNLTLDFKGLAAEGTVRGFAQHKKNGKIAPHRWNITHLNKYPL